MPVAQQKQSVSVHVLLQFHINSRRQSTESSHRQKYQLDRIYSTQKIKTEIKYYSPGTGKHTFVTLNGPKLNPNSTLISIQLNSNPTQPTSGKATKTHPKDGSRGGRSSSSRVLGNSDARPKRNRRQRVAHFIRVVTPVERVAKTKRPQRVETPTLGAYV